MAAIVFDLLFSVCSLHARGLFFVSPEFCHHPLYTIVLLHFRSGEPFLMLFHACSTLLKCFYRDHSFPIASSIRNPSCLSLRPAQSSLGLFGVRYSVCIKFSAHQVSCSSCIEFADLLVSMHLVNIISIVLATGSCLLPTSAQVTTTCNPLKGSSR